jgi:hypothetical protein
MYCGLAILALIGYFALFAIIDSSHLMAQVMSTVLLTGLIVLELLIKSVDLNTNGRYFVPGGDTFIYVTGSTYVLVVVVLLAPIEILVSPFITDYSNISDLAGRISYCVLAFLSVVTILGWLRRGQVTVDKTRIVIRRFLVRKVVPIADLAAIELAKNGHLLRRTTVCLRFASGECMAIPRFSIYFVEPEQAQSNTRFSIGLNALQLLIDTRRYGINLTA